jgi:ectoine hydroxylase-related dioxygenase (phytanoyl-CoA dioxygenase family)
MTSKQLKKRKKRAPRCKIPCIKPDTFSINDPEKWLQYLDEHGFVVIHNIIEKEDVEKATTMFKEEWCQVSPNFNWDNTATWTTDNSPMVWGKSSVVYNGFGQSNSNWLLRTKSRVKEAFTHVYKKNDLVASFDGFSLFISDTQKSPSWLHQDQRSNDDRLSVQGILNTLKCDKFDAGFICVPKSHKNYIPPPHNKDWIMLPKNNPNKKLASKILTPPCSLILFNSKLIHANIGMSKNHPNGMHINRFSAYITFVPRERQSMDILKKRIAGYYSGVACSHWADRFEPKRLPFHLKKRYIKRNFRDLSPQIDKKGNIPAERIKFI